MRLRNKKTGEIGDLLGTILAAGIICIGVDFHDGNPKQYCYNSLTELNEEWEDYTPAEPLIKDEKVRKAVRAWAEACFNDNEFWVIDLGERYFTLKTDRSDVRATFYSDNKIDGIEENIFYTITELCGEKEEPEDDEDEEDTRDEEY